MPAVTLHHFTEVNRTVVERLWQLYRHDLSEFRDSMPDEEGLFRPGRLPSYFVDPDCAGYLVRHEAALAGFALVRGARAEPRMMAEFFIVRSARRGGVGYAAALEAIRRHPGAWEIPFQNENPGAARFWRRLVADLVGPAVREERRPVPGKPHIPDDVFLLFTTPESMMDERSAGNGAG
jgi:predicted acetyltransferase